MNKNFKHLCNNCKGNIHADNFRKYIQLYKNTNDIYKFQTDENHFIPCYLSCGDGKVLQKGVKFRTNFVWTAVKGSQ